MSDNNYHEPDPEREGQDQYIRDNEEPEIHPDDVVHPMPVRADTQECDQCERMYINWPAGRCVIATDNKGLCPTCVESYEKTGATIDVQYFPGAQWHTKE